MVARTPSFRRRAVFLPDTAFTLPLEAKRNLTKKRKLPFLFYSVTSQSPDRHTELLVGESALCWLTASTAVQILVTQSALLVRAPSSGQLRVPRLVLFHMGEWIIASSRKDLCACSFMFFILSFCWKAHWLCRICAE